MSRATTGFPSPLVRISATRLGPRRRTFPARSSPNTRCRDHIRGRPRRCNRLGRRALLRRYAPSACASSIGRDVVGLVGVPVRLLRAVLAALDEGRKLGVFLGLAVTVRLVALLIRQRGVL